MVAAEPLQVRKAALLLHGLEPAARQQVIAQLAPAEVARVQPLLAELIQLGVPSSLGDRFSDTSVDAAARLSAQERVALMTPMQVAWGLQFCGALTAARLIESCSWPWSHDVLDCMAESRRVSVSALLYGSRAPLPPAVLEALCERLCDSAVLRPTADTATSAMPSLLRLQRALRRVVSWMR